ncbi:MAG: 1-acyl-sn-glycerol-3-phosphate acyltransferase [Desulfobacteraceae bacterium]|nr:1-acyl-sn-glycerol-3-phosphate acyltransferase [Desulfobacteraceae bacterium]
MKRFFKIAYQPYKWFIVIPLILIATIVLGLLCILAATLFNQDESNKLAVLWSRFCCAIAPVDIRLSGTRNYQKSKSYIVVANHQSMLDIPAVHGFLGLKIKWIMKKELGQIPIFGLACKKLGCIFIDRSDHDAALQSINDAKKELSKNASVLFFPEGTRSRDGIVMPFKKGAFFFAMETGLPILPITLKDTIKILPPDSVDICPGTARIIIHPAIHIKPSDIDRMDTIIQNTYQKISSGI